MVNELNKVIIGQREVIELILAAIFTRGHVLLVGVPGLAKTLMVSSIAKILDVSFKRIQFTPDLMPSDITGTNVLEEPEAGRRAFRFVAGAALREHHPGGRDQPDAPQDPGGALAGDAGTRGDGRAGDDAPARSVLRDRHPESDRAGRNLPAARSPARPLHVRHPGRLSDAGGREEDPDVDDQGRAARLEEGALGQGDRQLAEAGDVGAGFANTRSTT